MKTGEPNDENRSRERIAPAVVSALTAVAELLLGPQEVAERSSRSWSTAEAVIGVLNEEQLSEDHQDQLVQPSSAVITARQGSHW
jgi:hypothetical protein